jgi:hypothetical protein
VFAHSVDIVYYLREPGGKACAGDAVAVAGVPLSATAHAARSVAEMTETMEFGEAPGSERLHRTANAEHELTP